MDVEHCAGKLFGRFSERVTGRIGPGDAAQQGLEGVGGSDALQITHQRQAAVGLTTPTEVVAPSHGYLQLNTHSFTAESRQRAPSPGLQSEGAETELQAVGVLEDGWQDGEVGHRCHGRCGRP